MAPKSVIAVAGECSAARPAACGSMSVMPDPSTRERPGTPLAVAVTSSASSLPISDWATATTTLPHSSYGNWRSRQYSRSCSRPLVHRTAFRLPGL